MNRKIQILISLFLGIITLSGTLYSQAIPNDSLYLGQTPPGNKPKIFHLPADNGFFASERIAISTDNKEIFYGITNGYPSTKSRIKYFQYSDKWNGPFILCNNCGAPSLTIDERKLFGPNEWYMEKKDTGWSTTTRSWGNLKKVHYLEETNSSNFYLSSIPDKGGIGVMDWSKLIFSATDTTVQSLGLPLNTVNDEWDFFISRDESFIIMASGSATRKCFGYMDLFISFKKSDNTWTNPKNLGTNININDPNEARWGPYVSADNKYLFYSQGKQDPLTTNINWVRIDNLIDSLKYTNFIPYVKNSIPNQTAAKDLLFNYAIPDSIFIDDNGNNTLTYTVALSDGNPLPDWLSFNSATLTFSGVPNKIEADSIIVTATDTAGASASDIFTISNAVPTIDYFGQTPPGDSAVIFAPGIVSLTSSFTGGVTFSPLGNECCYGSFDGKDWTWGTIYYAKYKNNKWSKFIPAPFLDSTKYFDILPSFSPDGNRFIFSSARPSRQYNLMDLWMCERTSVGWRQPVRLDSTINNPNDDESFSSTATNGNIYFNKDLTNSIWFSKYIAGVYSKTSKVSEPVNSKYGAGSAFISPDESYIIFASVRPEGYGQRDLYLSFRKPDSTWTEPRNLGPKINDTTDDFCPLISPDRKYLFFTKGIKRKYSNIYWVSANVINEIKKEVFNPKIIK